MTDRQSFIDECLARPTDMTARLVFADWLEDNAQSREAATWRRKHRRDHTVSRVLRTISETGHSAVGISRYVGISYDRTHRIIVRLREAGMIHSRENGNGVRPFDLTDLGRVVLAAYNL